MGYRLVCGSKCVSLSAWIGKEQRLKLDYLSTQQDKFESTQKINSKEKTVNKEPKLMKWKTKQIKLKFDSFEKLIITKKPLDWTHQKGGRKKQKSSVSEMRKQRPQTL